MCATLGLGFDISGTVLEPWRESAAKEMGPAERVPGTGKQIPMHQRGT